MGEESIRPKAKKKKGRPGRPDMLARQPAVAQTREPVSSSGVAVPSARVPTPVVKLAAGRYPYIATELRTIGILAIIMLIVLTVLALVLA